METKKLNVTTPVKNLAREVLQTSTNEIIQNEDGHFVNAKKDLILKDIILNDLSHKSFTSIEEAENIEKTILKFYENDIIELTDEEFSMVKEIVLKQQSLDIIRSFKNALGE